MNFSQTTGRIADLAFVGFFALLLWSYPQLPERVVSHFGANGPDGWMAKNAFVALFAGTVIALEAMFRVLMPAMMRRGKLSFNTPYRSYWMATPERRQEAYTKVTAIIGPSRLFMTGVMLLALHACVQASGVPVFVEVPIQWLGFAIGGGTLLYTAAVFVWAFRVYKPPAEPGA